MTMAQLEQLSACPGCGEPLDAEDRYCGVCGADRKATSTEADFTLPPPQTPSGTGPSGTGRGGAGQRTANGAAEPPPRPGTAYTGPAPAPPAPPPPPAPAPGASFGSPDQAAPVAPPPQAPGRLPAPDPRGSHPPAGGQPAGGPPAGQQPAADPRLRHTELPPRGAVVACAVCGAGLVDSDGYCEDCGRAQPGDRDHVERSLESVAGVSDLGLRHHRNEDAFTISATALPDGSPAVIAVVCDGVSSSTRPHEASAAAAEAAGESLLASLPRGTSGQPAMHEALMRAGKAVNDLADPGQPPGQNAPACTVVSAVVASGELTVGWVGDSRAYWLPSGSGAHPIRLTEDDSWAAQMVKAGLLSEEEAMADRRAHAITAWLGADNPELEPHTAAFKPDRPGVVIVCTDGLWNYADAAEAMAARVPDEARTAPLPSAQQLVRFALDSGGHDNVTVAVIPFPPRGVPTAPPGGGPTPLPPTATQAVPRPDEPHAGSAGAP